LLFWHNQEKDTTIFSDIQRLAPAHSATWSASGHNIRRYWTMPIDEPLFLKRPDDYCDQFKELSREVVSDRMRTSRVGILMSGGLDSPTLAAFTREVGSGRGVDFDLKAFTDLDEILPEERYYAGLAAEHLDIPIEFRPSNGALADLDWEAKQLHSPEPC